MVVPEEYMMDKGIEAADDITNKDSLSLDIVTRGFLLLERLQEAISRIEIF